jgi:pimeloyl-[acyl-carrier protein] synthase
VIDADFNKVTELGNDLLLQINAIREVAPVIWSANAQAWIVTRHVDLVDAFMNRKPLSVVRYEPPFTCVPPEQRAARFPEAMRTLPHWPVFIDPPEHTRIRNLLMKAFSGKVVEGIRPGVRKRVAGVLDRAGTKGVVEFVVEVARTVTGTTILQMFGLPERQMEELGRWALVIDEVLVKVHETPEPLDRLEATLCQMRAVFDELIRERRAHPGEDFVSQLVHAKAGDDNLTDDEIVGICVVVLVAGYNTTMNSIALATVALARHPAARDYMLANPASFPSSLMEITRYIAMSTMQPRVVSEDFTWHGENLKKGDWVFLMIAGGNRDPRVFKDPERLDLTRPTGDVLVFGTGIHHCIGHLLAKMQLSEVLWALFERFDVEILDERITFAPPLGQRGPAFLNVRLTERSDSTRITLDRAERIDAA